MAILYTNPQNKPVQIHSYSAGNDFKYCKRKYKLTRIDGWKEKEKRVSLNFGEAIESSLQYFHNNELRKNCGVEYFTVLWDKIKNLTNLTYTEKEGSWEDLLQMGQEMVKLYEISLPNLPILDPKFQLNYRKEVCPNTYLAGIEYTSYVDMRCQDREGKPLIIDIKTAKSHLPDTHGILKLDPQLRSYAWVTGIPDVGFMWFVKMRPGNYKKGDEVTILEGSKTGTKAIVLNKETPEYTWVLSQADYEDFLKQSQDLKGKNLENIKQTFQKERGLLCFNKNITKQQLQFATAHISPEDIKEAGEAIGLEIAEIVAANIQGSFPKEPGIRFPNNKCLLCPMLGVCINEPKLIEEKLIKTVTSDWLSDLETE